MTEANLNLENPPINKAAQWAFRLAFIPYIGLPLYMILALVALHRTSTRGELCRNYLKWGNVIFICHCVLIALPIYNSWRGPVGLSWKNREYFEKISGYSYFDFFNDSYTLKATKKAWYLEKGQTVNGEMPFNPDPNRKWIAWHDNGVKAEEGSYFGIAPNGEWTYWYDNGNLKMTSTYQSGSLVGTWTQWHKNGKKKSEGEFLYVKVGTWKYWNEDGFLIKEDIYKDGQISYTTTYKPGEKREDQSEENK